MKKQEFEALLKRKEEEAKPTQGVDWEARKKQWLQSLEGFYSQVEGYLKEYVVAGRIKIETQSIQLNEEYIGEYLASSKYIYVGNSCAVLKPIGTTLIGAAGRVDMEGPTGTVKFVLVKKNSSTVRITIIEGDKLPVSKEPPTESEPLVWKIATPPPKVIFIDVSLETFLEALTKVING